MNNKTSFRRIDTIAIIIIAYFLIKWADSNSILPTWGALCASGIIGIIFYTFLSHEKVGRIIQSFASLFEAYFFATLLPFKSWLNKTPLATLNEYSFIAVITILLFLLIFELHNHGTSETIKSIFRKKQKQFSKSSFTSSDDVQSDHTQWIDNTVYNSLLDILYIAEPPILSRKTRTWYHEYVAVKQLGVIAWIAKVLVFNGEQTVKEICEIRFIDPHGQALEIIRTDNNYHTDKEFLTKITAAQEHYKIFNCRRFSDAEDSIAYAWLSTYEENSSRTNSETHNYNSSDNFSSQRNSDHGSNDESLFNGCTDKESLIKRYHQLMKTFHPDNPNGDHEMSQRIQNAYDTLRKKYE